MEKIGGRFTIKKKYVFTKQTPRADEIKLLASERESLVPCTLLPGEGYFELSFNTSGLMHFRAIDDLEPHDKLAVLISCGRLCTLNSEFDFSLSPDNLYLNNELKVLVLERTLRDASDMFCEKYKALIASVLHPEFSYEEYILKGRDILSKRSPLSDIFSADDVNSIICILSDMSEKLSEKKKKKIRTISGKKLALMKCALFLSLLSIPFMFIFSFISYSVQNEAVNSLSGACGSFISGDYENAISELNHVPDSMLSKEVMYIYAYSAVKLQPLKEGKKKEVLETLSPDSKEDLLLYWIETGRRNFSGARKAALKLKSQELIDYADARSISQ